MPSHANKLSAKAVVTTHTRNTCVTKHTPVMRKTWTNGRPSRVSAAAFATTAFATTAVATTKKKHMLVDVDTPPQKKWSAVARRLKKAAAKANVTMLSESERQELDALLVDADADLALL